ncbi:hypothetical protein [Nitrosopumilus sp. S6]
MDAYATVIQDKDGKKMKVEIIQSNDKSELDDLINTCIQDRSVSDIKLTTTALQDNTIQYTAMIMFRT